MNDVIGLHPAVYFFGLLANFLIIKFCFRENKRIAFELEHETTPISLIMDVIISALSVYLTPVLLVLSLILTEPKNRRKP